MAVNMSFGGCLETVMLKLEKANGALGQRIRSIGKT